MLTALREVIPLADFEGEVSTNLARRLLLRLLKIVRTLHEEYRLYSRDINKNTVYFLNDDYDANEIVFGGLCTPSADPLDAFEDSFQIFHTVRCFVNRDLPHSWLGNDTLDDLYRRAILDNRKSWHWDVVALCRHLETDPSTRSNELWSTLEIQKDFDIRFETANETSNLNSQDVMDYLYADAFLHSRKSAGNRSELYQKSVVALSQGIRDGKWISVAGYHLFRNHMKKRHASQIGSTLEGQLPGSRIGPSFTSPISVSLQFQVPYHAGHGLINFRYLRGLIPMSFDLSILEALHSHCYEVRGPRGLGGVYIAIQHLERLPHWFKLNDIRLVEPRDTSLEDFTSGKWYLLAPHESANLFPVDRLTGTVSLSGSRLPLAQFLSQYFDKETVHEAATEHSLAVLLAKESEMPVDHSCDGSVKPSTEDSVRFEFGRRTIGAPETIGAPATDLRVREWVYEREKKRRRRNRADIQPTIFGPRSAMPLTKRSLSQGSRESASEPSSSAVPDGRENHSLEQLTLARDVPTQQEPPFVGSGPWRVSQEMGAELANAEASYSSSQVPTPRQQGYNRQIELAEGDSDDNSHSPWRPWRDLAAQQKMPEEESIGD
jgi:hypothetical protein